MIIQNNMFLKFFTKKLLKLTKVKRGYLLVLNNKNDIFNVFFF